MGKREIGLSRQTRQFLQLNRVCGHSPPVQAACQWRCHTKHVCKSAQVLEELVCLNWYSPSWEGNSDPIQLHYQIKENGVGGGRQRADFFY